MKQKHVFLNPAEISKFFTIIIIVLLVAHIVGQFLRFGFGIKSEIISGFNFGYERNFPTFYSSFLLLLCSLILFFISFVKKILNDHKNIFHWSILGIIFLFLSLDEMLVIHEKLIKPLRHFFDASGYFYFAWVIPYSVLVLILFITYFKFLRSLDKKTKMTFILSGITFISGAIVMEMIGANHFEVYGDNNPVYVIYQTIEEVLEMSGVVIFIYGLISYLNKEFKDKIIINF